VLRAESNSPSSLPFHASIRRPEPLNNAQPPCDIFSNGRDDGWSQGRPPDARKRAADAVDDFVYVGMQQQFKRFAISPKMTTDFLPVGSHPESMAP